MTMKELTKLCNKNFIITFQPNNPAKFGNRKRFSVGAGRLAVYVGEHNAKTLLLNALDSTEDRYLRRLRKEGSVTFYSK